MEALVESTAGNDKLNGNFRDYWHFWLETRPLIVEMCIFAV
jgi:hypothetical protein